VVDFTGTLEPQPWQRPLPPATALVLTGENTVHVYPNPVVTQLIIDTQEQNVRVEILDMTGKRLYIQAGVSPISMASFDKGMYIVTVSTNKGILKTVKIIK